jgi:hypothetical protein
MRDCRMRRIALLLPGAVRRECAEARDDRAHRWRVHIRDLRLVRLGRRCSRRDEGLTIDRDAMLKSISLSCWSSQVLDRRGAPEVAGEVVPQEVFFLGVLQFEQAIMASVRCTRIICWR